MSKKQNILDWAIRVTDDSDHPYCKWVEKYLEGYEENQITRGVFEQIWEKILDDYYDEFGSGDVGMDWDPFEETWDKDINKPN